MKVSQKIISLILVLTMAMGLATAPSFAAAENTEYENSLKAGWGSTYTNWTAPSGYGYSWNAQVLRFFTEFNTRIKNIYDTLGTTNSVLGDIKTRTGYIPTINDNILKLYSGWGSFPNWSQPSSMGSSWYAWVQKALYQYRSDLSDIVSNTSYLPNYDGYLSQITTNSGITSNNTTSIVDILSNFTARTSNVWWRTSDKYSLRRTGQSGSYNVGGFAIPERATSSNNSGETYRWKFISSNNISLLSALESMSITDNFTLSKLMTPYSSYLQTVYDSSTNSIVNFKDDYGYDVGALSLADIIDHYNRQFLLHLGKLQFALADDDMITAKNANKPQEQNVITNFTGSGSASASVNDFTGVKDSVSALKTSLSGGASYTQAFNILDGSSDGWSWFTNEVAESMDSTGNGNTRLRSVSNSTPYLDAYYEQLSSYLGYSYNGGIE